MHISSNKQYIQFIFLYSAKSAATQTSEPEKKDTKDQENSSSMLSDTNHIVAEEDRCDSLSKTYYEGKSNKE